MMPEELRKAIDIFYSYSPKDEALRNKLETQLNLLERQNHITGWYDRKIVPGKDWADEIDTHLNSAHLILLLVSPDYIASDYCYGIEMKQALKRHEAGEARVIPVILRPVEWSEAPFGKLYALPKQAKPVTTWQNRDAAFADIAKGIRKAIEELNSQSLINSVHHDITLGDNIPTLPSIWNVPYRRNPFFTGRDDILHSLHDNFILNSTSLSTRPQALSGLGGVGKTQIATEYAYHFHRDYQTVLWARAESREILTSDFAAFSGLLKLPEKKEQDDIVNTVKYWLKVNSNWLLILDNVEELEMIVDFIPSEDHGHVLLTTRRHAMGEIAQRVKVDGLEPEAGSQLLLYRASIIGTGSTLNDASRTDRITAKEISQAMGGLPLGLDQAAAYIEETDCGLPSYLDLFQKEGVKLLQRRGKGVSSHPEPVSTTWTLSFEKVQHSNLAAANLLRLCAFLQPDIIPLEIIAEGASELDSIIQHIANDSVKLDAIIEELLKFSLVRRDSKTNTLSIHRLVQTVIKDEMNEDEQLLWAKSSIQAVNHVFPESEYTTWDRCQRYISQAQACTVLIDQWELELIEAAELMNKAGNYLIDRGQYTQAEPLLLRAKALSEKIYGLEHPKEAFSITNLGRLYREQGKYTQAESLLQKALALCKKIYDPEDVKVAEALRILALVYRDQGKLAQEELLLQQAFSIVEKVHKHEPDHPDIGSILSSLGSHYWHQHNYTQAEPLMKRALKIKEKALQPNHPSIVNELSNLGALYVEQGKYLQAAAQQERILKILVRNQGQQHPAYAAELDNLGSSYMNLRRYLEAERLHKRALAIREKTYGPDHLAVALSLNNLALVFSAQGHYSRAEPLFQRALAIQEKALELEHPNMARILLNYASLLRKTKRKPEAAELEARAEAIKNRHKQERNIVKW